MGESELIRKTKRLNTISTLKDDLKRLGLTKGMTVIVHSSLSSIGWVAGGAVAVVQALMDVVTEEGTIVMPAHSANVSDPSQWENPPVPKEWVESIKEEMPPFNPRYTQTYFMGQIVEAFRTFPNVVRSNHPTVSFAAWGKYSERIVEGHTIDYGLGEQSPLRKIYDLDGYILLLGVGHDSNTSLHLSEHRTGGSKTVTNGSPVVMNGDRVWKVYREIDYRDDFFEQIGADFEANYQYNKGKVGMADSKLIKQRIIVDFSTKWFNNIDEKS